MKRHFVSLTAVLAMAAAVPADAKPIQQMRTANAPLCWVESDTGGFYDVCTDTRQIIAASRRSAFTPPPPTQPPRTPPPSIKDPPKRVSIPFPEPPSRFTKLAHPNPPTRLSMPFPFGDPPRTALNPVQDSPRDSGGDSGGGGGGGGGGGR